MINYLGVKFGSRVQAAFTLVKVLAVVAIIAIGFLFYQGAAPAVETQVAEQSIGLANFFLAVGAGLFAYGGWHMVTYTAEETLNPTRTIPRSLMIGVAVVTLCYIGLNVVYLSSAADAGGDELHADCRRHLRSADRATARPARSRRW